jgi:hypothetical protein
MNVDRQRSLPGRAHCNNRILEERLLLDARGSKAEPDRSGNRLFDIACSPIAATPQRAVLHRNGVALFLEAKTRGRDGLEPTGSSYPGFVKLFATASRSPSTTSSRSRQFC